MDGLSPGLIIGGSLYLWLMVAIAAHETAHAVVGKMVGFSPYAIDVGKGSILFKFHLFGVRVAFHTIPAGGITLAHAPGNEDLRWRGVLYALAGTFADIVLLLILLWMNLVILKDSPTTDLLSFIGWCAAILQGLSILGNLWPRDSSSGLYATPIPNDGKSFLQYFNKMACRLPADLEHKTTMRMYDPEFQIENSWLKKGAPDPLRTLLEIQDARLAKDYQTAIGYYLDILASPVLSNAERAMFLDSMVSIVLIDGDRHFSKQALAWAREAHELFPNLPTLRGSYGGALIESGEYVRGIEMLTPLTAKENTPIDRSISACYLAKAHHHLGNAAEADAFLTLGKALNASCGVCERIEQELMLPKNDSG